MFSLKLYRQVQKSRFHVFVGKLWREERFLKKNFYQPLAWRKNLSAFCQNFSDGVVETTLYFQNYFFENFNGFFINLRNWSTFCRLSGLFFRRGCQNCILRVIGKHLMRKKTWKIWIFSLLWVFERKFFAFFPNSLCLICQNCIPRVHRKLEWKLFLHKVSIFCYIGTLSEYFCPLVGNLPAVFSKLPSLCLKQRFEKNCFFLKEILLFSSFLVNEQKLFDILAFFGKVVKTRTGCP